jgi:hypothetical protein
MLGRIVGARPAWSRVSKPPTKGDACAIQIIAADRDSATFDSCGPTRSDEGSDRLGRPEEG